MAGLVVRSNEQSFSVHYFLLHKVDSKKIVWLTKKAIMRKACVNANFQSGQVAGCQNKGEGGAICKRPLSL